MPLALYISTEIDRELGFRIRLSNFTQVFSAWEKFGGVFALPSTGAFSVKNIRLTDDPAEIDCRVNKTAMVLRTEFVKKA